MFIPLNVSVQIKYSFVEVEIVGFVFLLGCELTNYENSPIEIPQPCQELVFYSFARITRLVP